MKVFIRADVSVTIGSGYVMRCLTLAEEFRLQGVAVSFIRRGLPGKSYFCHRTKGFGLNYCSRGCGRFIQFR